MLCLTATSILGQCSFAACSSCKCLIKRSYHHCVSFVWLAVATSRYSNEELKKALRHDIDDLARLKALQVQLPSTHLRFPERIWHENLPRIQLAVNLADMLHLLGPSACLCGDLQGKAALMHLVESQAQGHTGCRVMRSRETLLWTGSPSARPTTCLPTPASPRAVTSRPSEPPLHPS